MTARLSPWIVALCAAALALQACGSDPGKTGIDAKGNVDQVGDATPETDQADETRVNDSTEELPTDVAGDIRTDSAVSDAGELDNRPEQDAPDSSQIDEVSEPDAKPCDVCAPDTTQDTGPDLPEPDPFCGDGECNGEENTCSCGDDCPGEVECDPNDSTDCGYCGHTHCSALCKWNPCEESPGDSYEPNDTENTAWKSYDITDNDAEMVTIEANINPQTDVDWYSVQMADTSSHSMKPRFILSNVPSGAKYYLSVEFRCEASNKVYQDAIQVTGAGEVSFEDLNCTESFLKDDTGTAYIVVEPISGASCMSYQLQFHG